MPEPAPADDPDQTLIASRRRRGGEESTVRTGRAAPNGGIRATPTAPAARTAADGTPEKALYRPRPADPVRVARADPAPHAPQRPVDTASRRRAARRTRARTAAVVAGAVVLVVAIAAAVISVLLTWG